MKVGTIMLPNGKVSTAYIKNNWAAIISGPLLKILPVDWVKEEHQCSTVDAIKWLQDPTSWKRFYKKKLEDGDEEYWGGSQSFKDHIARGYWTDEFADGMDLNFISSPKDGSLLSIHLHSD